MKAGLGMTKIVLDVNDENLGSVITVLNSLKEGLIEKMEVETLLDTTAKSKKFTRYQPKTDRVIYEEEQASLEKMGKYVNPAEFKKKLQQKRQKTE